MASAGSEEIGRVFREVHGRAVAALVRIFGDIDVAEESVQDAFVAALDRWPSTGLPPSPARWIVATARRQAIDRLRREATRGDRHAHAARPRSAEEPGEETLVSDDVLRLIFTCCHPALSSEAQVALTLRLVCGLTTAEIAHGFLVLSDEAEFLYKTTEYWHPEHERCIRWDDSDLAIAWPALGTPPVVSTKDAAGTPFREAPLFDHPGASR